jgi:hypothetical protein
MMRRKRKISLLPSFDEWKFRGIKCRKLNGEN